MVICGLLPPQWSRWEKSAYGEVAIKLRPKYEQVKTSFTEDRPSVIGIEADLSAQGPKRVHIKGRASLIDQKLDIHESLIEIHNINDQLHAKPRQALKAKGQIDLEQKQIKGQLALKGDISPQMIPPLHVPLQSKLDLKLNVSGSLSGFSHRRLKSIQFKSDVGGYPWRFRK